MEEGKKYTYNFWKNKPVIKFDGNAVCSKRIESDLKKRTVYGSTDEIKLPSSMQWNLINLNNKDLEPICEFLKLHYVADKQNKFKLDYSPEFIKWSLGTDGILIAITLKSNGAICGVVGCYFKNFVVFDKTEKFGVVNFLCAHPVYRKKKISFTLIDEITRRIVQSGVNQGCFTTERCIPTPITLLRYYHRPINYTKLNKHEFTIIEGDQKVIAKRLAVSDKFPKNFVEMNESHLPEVLTLYNKFMFRFNIYCKYTEEDLKTMLLNNDIVRSYVIMKDELIVDFVSYYKLPYNINESDEKINTGYLFLYSSETITGSDIIRDVLQSTSKDNLDLFNVIDIGNIFDALLLKDTGLCDSDYESHTKSYQHYFMKGSGKLFFNFFNWQCQEIATNQMFINIF
jgi:glycylpeptide N-tetradecanoyltransferase